MLVNEIAKKCEITKKAVQYYVEQGLLMPNVLENGYHDFSFEEERKLKQIVLYRKLGLSISEIKNVLKDPKEVSNILHQRKLLLEEEKIKQNVLKEIELGKNVEDFTCEINNINSKQVVLNKLMELFPGYFGKLICLNFSRYLNGRLEDSTQLEAFYQIIEFFEQVEEVEIEEDVKVYLDEMEKNFSDETYTSIFEEKEAAIQNIQEFLENKKEVLEEYRKYKESEEYKDSIAYKLNEHMKKICNSSGYYEVFIPAMRKLSPSYNTYYETLLKANEIFIKEYPEYEKKKEV